MNRGISDDARTLVSLILACFKLGFDQRDDFTVRTQQSNGGGKNFGWPAFEGSVGGTCTGKTLGGPAPHTPPIVTVDRRSGSTSPFADYNSIIGGRVRSTIFSLAPAPQAKAKLPIMAANRIVPSTMR